MRHWLAMCHDPIYELETRRILFICILSTSKHGTTKKNLSTNVRAFLLFFTFLLSLPDVIFFLLFTQYCRSTTDSSENESKSCNNFTHRRFRFVFLRNRLNVRLVNKFYFNRVLVRVDKRRSTITWLSNFSVTP